MGRFKNSSTGRWQVATGHSQQGRPGGDGRGVGHPGAGRRGQVQPAGAAPEVGSLFFCQRSSRSLCWGWVLQFRKVAPKIWTILFLTSSIFNSKVWNNDLVEPNFWYRWSLLHQEIASLIFPIIVMTLALSTLFSMTSFTIFSKPKIVKWIIVKRIDWPKPSQSQRQV